MKILLVLMITSVFFMTNSFAVKNGKTLYKKCRGCHGTDGKNIPFEKKNGLLAGREKIELEFIIKAMHDGYYEENKQNKIMQKVITKFNPEEISMVAEYISKFKK